jgi:hypothetical protein
MADDSLFITRRLKRIAEATKEELEASGDTIVLEKSDIMETVELRRLLDPAGELTNAIEADLQNDRSE